MSGNGKDTPAWAEHRSMDDWVLWYDDGKSKWRWWHPGLAGKAPDPALLVRPGSWECAQCGELETSPDGDEDPPDRLCCPPGPGPADWPDDFWTRLDEDSVGPLPAEPVTDEERRADLEAHGQMRMAL